jgi:anti-sigma B factor antagonist
MLRDHPLTITIQEGSAHSARIITLTGPVTLPNLFILQDELRNGEPPSSVILDLTGVPYMDSAGIGAIINYFVHLRKRNAKLIVVGVNGRVIELFKLTGADTVITMAATVEEAQSKRAS